MEADVIERFRSCEGVLLSRDCRMDSPGFSTVKGTYSLMDDDSGTIISIEHGDKRQVNITSYILNDM